MPKPFVWNRRVEFRDTDMAGIVHFSVFFAYMEQAEHEFLRHLGIGVISELDGQSITWPRVSARCDYRQAIRYDEIVDIEVTILRLGEKSVTYGFHITRGDELIAEGKITAVCCIWHKDAPPESTAIPDTIRQKLEPFQVAP